MILNLSKVILIFSNIKFINIFLNFIHLDLLIDYIFKSKTKFIFSKLVIFYIYKLINYNYGSDILLHFYLLKFLLIVFLFVYYFIIQNIDN